ncbi:MAG: hypothetical protein H0U98_14345 [Alphaproteobacteria bacterium]|nr:hypothetical protein [Alphaproteobacteria bacterium]
MADGTPFLEFLRSIQLALTDYGPTGNARPATDLPLPLSLVVCDHLRTRKILFTPNKAAEIFGEVKKGTWLDDTIMFPVVEHVGEVTNYGDFNENGHTGVNTNWPQRQAFLFQTMEEYGDREVERAGLARLNWVSEMDMAAATVMSKYGNLTYFFGVGGLQLYGLLNISDLSASLTPANKVHGGNEGVVNNEVVAAANEIVNDIQSLWIHLASQANGLIDEKAKIKLCTLQPAWPHLSA